MADWILIPCLRALFMEFDRIAPSRDKASDGSIGDAAHRAEVSDHNADEEGSVPIHDADHVNEVHAIDVDNNLRESDLTMEKVVQFLLGRCRSGAEKRLRYIIYNRRIWSASSDWVQKTYTGASPHTEHAHFSASYTSSLEASTASWHLEDIPVALTTADKTWIEGRLDQRALEDQEDIKVLLESGAVARGLRSQPNNLSDGEREKLTEVIRVALTASPEFLNAVAEQVLLAYKIPGTTTPGDGEFTRSLSQLAADPWALAMRGNTLAAHPIPENGVFGLILKGLADLEAKVDAL